MRSTISAAPPEQWIKEGKNAIKWTRLSCRKFDHNAVRLQLHALAYNLGNFMRTLALPDSVEQWSLTTLTGSVHLVCSRRVRLPRHPRQLSLHPMESDYRRPQDASQLQCERFRVTIDSPMRLFRRVGSPGGRRPPPEPRWTGCTPAWAVRTGIASQRPN